MQKIYREGFTLVRRMKKIARRDGKARAVAGFSIAIGLTLSGAIRAWRRG